MQINKGYKHYTTFKKISQLKKSLALLCYLLYTIQFICLAFLMLINMQTQFQKSSQFASQLIHSVLNNYLTPNVLGIFGWLSIGLCVLILICINTRIRLQSNYDEVRQYQKADTIMLAISIFLWGILELCIYISIWGFSQAYKQQGAVVFFSQSMFPIIVYTYYNYKLKTPSLYVWFTIPVILLVTAFEAWYSYIAIISISVYLIFARKQLVKKIYYAIVIIIALFILKNQHLFRQVDGSDTKIPFVYLGVSILVAAVLFFKIRAYISVKNIQQTIDECLASLSQLKSDFPYSQMKFQEFYEIYKTITNLVLSSKDEKSPQLQKILEKPHSKMSKKDFFLLFQGYLEKQCKKSTKGNQFKQILRLRTKMQTNNSMNETIGQMFTLSQQFQRSNKKHQNQFYQLFDEVIKKFAISKNETLYPAYIIHINKLHQNFQSQIYQVLEKLTNFFKEMSLEQIKRSTIDQKFDEIVSLENKIQRQYAMMEKLGNFQTEKDAIDIIRTAFNVYEQENTVSSNKVQKLIDQSRTDKYYSFLIIENDLVKFFSKNLLKSLGLKGGLAFENINKKALFGEEFTCIIDDIIEKMDLLTQQQWVTVPIICQNGSIQLKKIKIMWFPSLESKKRQMIKFASDSELSSQSFLIYHFKSDTIRYFNSKFISNFNIDQQKFHYQLENYQLFFNELFINTDVPVEEIKSYLKQESTIRCKIYLKSYVQKGAIPSTPVQLKVLRCISIDNEPTFCMIKVCKLKQKKAMIDHGNSESNPENRSKSRQNMSKLATSNQNILEKRYENEKFFCKIPNHYESKITEKQAQLQEPGRFIYRYFIHALFSLMFCTVLVFWIMDYKFLQDRIKNYQKQMVAIQNTSEQYALLYQAYSVAIKRYYIKKYSEQIQLVKSVPGFVYDEIYKMAEQNFLNEFLRRYLTQINQPPNRDIGYGLNFNYFSISTDTSKSTLMDFAEHIKRNLAIPEVDFLLKNYHNFRDLTLQFESSFVYEDKITDVVQGFTPYLWALIGSTTLSILAILYVLWKIEDAIEIIYSLVELISVAQFKENIRKFQLKKKRIIKVFYKSGQYQQNDNAEVLASITSDKKTSTQQDQNSLSELSNASKSQISPKDYVNDALCETQPNQNQDNEEQSFLQLRSKVSKPKKRLVDESLMVKIYRKSFFVLLFIGLNIVFVQDYIHLKQQKDGVMQLFQMKQRLYVSLLHIKRQEVDAPMSPTLIDYYKNSKNTTLFNKSSLTLVQQISDTLINDRFSDFGQTARITLSSDMCKFFSNYTPSSPKKCQTYLNGIVTKGFSQTFDIYIQNAKKVSEQSLTQFGTTACTQQQCSPYYEHQFVSVLMGETIRYVIYQLNEVCQKVFNQLMRDSKLQIAKKVAGLVVILIVYLICDRQLRNRCKKTIKFFRIIPKDIMCSIKLTTYIRKYKVLNKFDIL